jgi:type II secretory pathway component PulF
VPRNYAFEAADARGRRTRGRAEAESPAALVRALEGRGLLAIRLSEIARSPDRQAKVRLDFSRHRAVLDATRALAALLSAGMPLARALAAARNVSKGEVATALGEIRRRVEGGESLADALMEHGHLFPSVYVGLVRAGERGSELATAFERLAEQLEREANLHAKLLSASIYPLVLSSVGGVAVLVLLFLVLPRFVDLLGGTGAALPPSTALLLALSTTVRRFWPVLLGGGAIAGSLVAAALSSGRGRRKIAALSLRTPLLGALRRNVLGARFARLLGVLLGGGAPLLGALDDVRNSLGDPLAREEVERIRRRVREGASLHQSLLEGNYFPPVLGQLVAVGEEASRLQLFLLKAADLLEQATERTVQRLVTLAEPAMIVLFGGIVAFVALSLLQAIYGINADAFR